MVMRPVREDVTLLNGNKGWSMHQLLTDNINDNLIRAVKNKWDGIVLVTGMEGSAKSTLSFAMAKYVDPSFCLDNVVFTQEQFTDMVIKSPPKTAIVWDEFVLGGLSTDALSQAQTQLIKLLTTIRKKQLYIFLIIPSVFMLRLYFILRTRFLVHCYSPDGVSRGHFKFYNYELKREMYVKGRKNFDMSVVYPNFLGKFYDYTGFFIDVDAYDQKKESAIQSLGKKGEKVEKVGKRELLWKNRFLRVFHRLMVVEDMLHKTQPEIRNWYNRYFGEDLETSRMWELIDCANTLVSGLSDEKEEV